MSRESSVYARELHTSSSGCWKRELCREMFHCNLALIADSNLNLGLFFLSFLSISWNSPNFPSFSFRLSFTFHRNSRFDHVSVGWTPKSLWLHKSIHHTGSSSQSIDENLWLLNIYRVYHYRLRSCLTVFSCLVPLEKRRRKIINKLMCNVIQTSGN